MNDIGPSPFYEDISDERRKEESKLHAREAYEQYSRLRAEAFTGHLEYGKWMLGFLLAVHGSSLVANLALMTVMGAPYRPELVNGTAWTAAGICLALLAGLLALLNFQLRHEYYTRGLNPAVLYRSDQDPSEDGVWRINFTQYAALLAVLLSTVCFAVCSAHLIWALRTA